MLDEIVVKFRDGSQFKITKDELVIDEADITGALSKQPGLYAWVAVQYSKAKDDVAVAEDILERTIAAADERVRKGLPGKATETEIKRLISNDPEVQTAKAWLAGAEATRRIVEGVLEAMKQRSSSAVALGYLVRREIENSHQRCV